MPKKIEAYLTLEELENKSYIQNEKDLIYYMRGYFEGLAFDYEKMNVTQIKSELEDLKVIFQFLDKMRERIYKNE